MTYQRAGSFRAVFLSLGLLGALGLFDACSGSKRDFASTVGGSGGAAGSSAGVAGNGGSAGSARGGAGAVGGSASAGKGGSAVTEAGAAGEGGAADDACAGVVCDTPPANDCESASKFLAYDHIGTCVRGACSYTSQEIACECDAHACKTDPCAQVTCTTPPATVCKDAHTVTKYAAAGTCTNGSCSYVGTDTACAFGCANGACTADPCIGVSCASPPASDCESSTKFKAYDKTGSCAGGTCTYAFQEINCTCSAHECTVDPCISITCASPPAATCKNANTLTKYATSGTCSGGSCSYAPTDSACAFGCNNGACKPDPCQGITCNTPPGPTCKDTLTQTTYAATGTCSGGTCSYAPTNTACPSNDACSGSGVCSLCTTDNSCGPTCSACTGNTPLCQTGNTSPTQTISRCIAPVTGCNTVTKVNSLAEAGTSGGTIVTGTHGTIIAGTYVLSMDFGEGGDSGLSQYLTIVITVSGSTATLNAMEDYGSGLQYRWSATVTMGSSPTFQYTCIVDTTGQTEPPLNTNQPFDYSVMPNSLLVLEFPDSFGSSAGHLYQLYKQ